MSEKAIAESIIELAAQLKAQVTSLRDEYARLPHLIEKEHRAIRAHDLGLIQAIGKEKQVAGDYIESCFHSLVSAAQELGRCLDRLGGPSKDINSLSDCVEVFDAILPLIEDQGLAAKVLRHQVDGLREAVKSLVDLRIKTQPQIEQNKYLLEAMLINYQESYRFWLSLCEETTTAYNAQGQQKSQGRLSGFQARA